MEFETVGISRWPGNLRSPVRLLVKAGVGLSFILAVTLPAQKSQSEKNDRSQTVNQPECHSEHQNDKITELASSVRQCKSCGHYKDQSAFASKGRDRPSALCKGCDNKRRRSSYTPKITVPDWDNFTVNIELLQGDQSQLAPLVWEVLVDQKIVGDVATNFKDETLDSVLDRRSAIDAIIERG